MTTSMHQIQLDRWLICSDPAFRSLSEAWRGEAGAASLLDWRLANRIIEPVPMYDLKERLDLLAAHGAWAATVVVDGADVALIEILEKYADRLAVHLIEWHQSPLASVLAMNAPDRQLMAVLQLGSTDPVEILSDLSDRQGYEAALAAWEQACRENDSELFAQTLPAFAVTAIPWHSLVMGSQLRDDLPVAANDNWIELVRLAAASANEPGKAISLEDPRNTPAQWTLMLSPIDDGPATLAVFRVNQSAIPAFKGCAIRLKVKGEIIDLGEIDEEGQAEIILPSPVEMQGLAIAWEQGA
jgi:hypothetical protein